MDGSLAADFRGISTALRGRYGRALATLFCTLAILVGNAISATEAAEPDSAEVSPSGITLGALGTSRSALVDSAEFAATLDSLVGGYSTREIGSPGNRAAERFIIRKFQEIGLQNVSEQQIAAAVAHQRYAYALLPLTTGGYDTVALRSYRPNFARTNTLPPDGIHGNLVYTRTGEAVDYDGKPMEGAIELAEMSVGGRWRLASTLGAQAVIFIQSENPELHVTAEFNTSVDFPRFWVAHDDGERLHAWAEAHPDEKITIKARQPWEFVDGQNIIGFIPGSDSVLSRELVVITAPFDSYSQVEGLAPGAEAALSMASELELARIMHDHPPSRSVLFAALNGQASDVMLGGRSFVLALRQSYPDALKQQIAFLRKDLQLISDRHLAGKFPAYRSQVLKLQDRLDDIASNQLSEASDRWNDLMSAREAYREDASPEEKRLGLTLYRARRSHDGAMAKAAAQFLPAFDATVDALRPIIAEFGRLRTVYEADLERDARTLEPIVAADSNKIRTSVRGRLAAARLTDIDKALKKVSRISADDHTRRLDRICDDLRLIRPVLGYYPALLIDLSITSRSRDLGLFYKGYFYNQQPDLELKRAYSGLGKQFGAYARDRIFVDDLHRLWSMPDSSIRAIIYTKIDTIRAHRELYASIQNVATSDTDTIISYSWYQRFFNATGWFWALLAAVGFLLLARRWKQKHEEEEDARMPRWYLGGMGLSVLIALYGIVFGFNWRNVEHIYHGIDDLIWNHTDLLVNAEQIPREEKTKIRQAAEKHEHYTDVVATPKFFAENIINAIPATMLKLHQDSIVIAQQFVLFDSISTWRDIPPIELRPGQIDTLSTFITFLGLAGDRHYVNCVAGVAGKGWPNFLPRPGMFTSEIATLAGMPAVALATVDDVAPYLNTPDDRLAFVNVPNAVDETRTLAALVTQALADPLIPDDFALGSYYAQATGTVLFDDRKASVTADEPIDSAIVIADRGLYQFRTLSDRRGSFHFIGLPIDGRSWVRSGDQYWLHAYKMNPDSGNIDYAVDLGNEEYAFQPAVTQRTQDWSVVVFRCASVSVTDLMDPRYFQYLVKGDVYDARTDSKPWHYFTHIRYGDNTFFVEPGTRVKITFAQGLLGVRMMLTNVPDSIRIPQDREGVGFPVNGEVLLTHTAYQSAYDMWNLDEGRLQTLVRHGIIDEQTRAIHDSTARYLHSARIALAARQYDVYLTDARSALALESRVLPAILDTANGALKGVLFYMTLLLPFAFFLERLVIGSTDVRRQVLWFFGLFILMFLLIEQVHPAFDITVAPPMVLLAFTVFALSVFVVSIIIGKFTAQMQQIRREQQGYLSADVGRVSAMLTAFMLGVSNMRKRKVRTTLTCVTLILLTFTVLSFTSVREVLRVNRIRLSDKTPPYSGVLIRDPYWNFWPPQMLSLIQNELGRKYVVVGRAWREATSPGQQGQAFYFTLKNAANGNTYTLSGFVGMQPEENEVTGIFKKAGVAGRWFNQNDLYSLVIPQTAADALGITREQVTGDLKTAPVITMQGIHYRVIGILDDEAVRKIHDIDGEEITSVDWSLVDEQRQTREQQITNAQQITTGSSRETFIHLVPAQCMFVPFRIVQGGLVSVAIRTPTYADARSLISRVIPKWALEMYVGERHGTYLYSAIGLTTLGGLGAVLIPILIAALIVLNTMLGAVYERTREIGIFSSIGLAPSHIAMLFMAEATVYAVLGAIAGYLLGQTVGQIIYKTGLLAGVTLNYSSTSAITSTLIVMATVIVSTIYPAKKASEISVPDIARTWRLPEANGDEWYFALPFTLMNVELEGLNAFLAHFFEQHHDESASDFYIDRVDFWAEDGRFMLETMVWLAPYDLGVSELVTMISSPTPDEPDLYSMSLLVTRQSGDVPSWNRVNRRFVNFLRKQFLVWRTLTPVERQVFHDRGREMFSVDGTRIVERSQTVEA